MTARLAEIVAEPFLRLPTTLRRKALRANDWTHYVLQGREVDCFLEGPAFDRNGNLYLVDIPNGRVLRASPTGEFSVVSEYDGEPSGLQIHRDGRIFVTDHKMGLLTVDPDTGGVTVLLDRVRLEGFRGLSDLVFGADGSLFFTDQGQSDMRDPSGCVYQMTDSGDVRLLASNVPSPNGIAIDPSGAFLYVAATRANSVWRFPLLAEGGTSKVSSYINLSGGAGPDGLATDVNGGLAVAHYGLGTVWIFDQLGEPVFHVRSGTGLGTTNVAYGGMDRRFLYITEAESGVVLRAELPTPGSPTYADAIGDASAPPERPSPSPSLVDKEPRTS